MIFRCIFLYLTGIARFYRRLRHDWAQEIVVFLSAAVVMALFFYVFNDFLNVEVASLSVPMRNAFSSTIAWIGYGAAMLLAGKSVAAQWSRDGNAPANFAEALGESPKVVFALRCLFSLTAATATLAVFWIIAARLLVPWGVAIFARNGLFLTPLAVAGCLVSQQLAKRIRTLDRVAKPFISFNLRPNHARVRWRFQIFAKRSVAARVAKGGSVAFGLLFTVLSFRQAPNVALYGAAFLVGFHIFVALAFTLALDLSSIWFEKSSGSSHDDVVGAYGQISISVAIGVGLLVAVAFLAPHLMRIDSNWSILSEALRLGLVAAAPILLFPSLMFQIDGRRPITQVMAGFLISLFLSTAIYASWFALILLPIVQHYGLGIQKGRLYRA